jgi:hypothetical protein
MTYHLASLRLRSIGERSARFTDLTLDLTAPTAEGHAVPDDSIVWLRNGGGKSSLLSLFYALLLPHANDFMGRAVRRSLTDYVDSGDTSHTVAVWHPAEGVTLLGDPERVLVTGAIYEWQDLRRPAEPDRERDRLQASYYAFFAVPGVIDPSSLPLTDDGGAPLRRSAVIARLRELAAEHPSAMDLATPRSQGQWTDELRSRGIDPELYRRQKEMNHVEGGVEDLFRFASAREFIDFLLDLTVAPDEATPVADRLAQIADLLAQRPAKVDERAFCQEAAIALRRTAVAHDDVAAARAGAEAAAAAARRLGLALNAAADQARERGAELDDQAQALLAARDDAERARREAGDLEHLFRHHGARLRVAAAQAGLREAQDTAGRVQRSVEAWRLTHDLADAARLTVALEKVRADAAELRTETAPLRAERDRYAAAVLDRLEDLAARAQAQARAARDSAAKLQATADELAAGAAAARAEENGATAEIATATAHLSAIEEQVLAAVGTGVLPDPDVDLVRETGRRTRDRDRCADDLAGVQRSRAERPGLRRRLTDRLQELSSERSRVDGERARAVLERGVFGDRAAALAADPRVRDLAEATEADPVDVWAEGPVLAQRLVDEIRRLDELLIRIEAARVDDRRTLDAQSRTGLLPTSLDAARVLDVLRENDVPAEAGWTHLRENWPGKRLSDALTDPALARLGCGVVVPTDRAQRAAAVLSGMDTVTTALVEVYPASAVRWDDPPAAPPRPAWSGLHRGLVDPAVAGDAAAAIRARHDADESARVQASATRDACRELAERLAALHRDCPDGGVAALERRVAEFDHALDGIDAGLHESRERLGDLDAADERDAARERDLLTRIADLTGDLAALKRLRDLAAAGPQWRDRLASAQRLLQDARDRAERLTRQERDARAGAGRVELQAGEADMTAAAHREEAARIDFLEGRPVPPGEADADPAVPLDALRQRFRDADGTYQQQVSGSVLAERERNLSEQLAAVTGVLGRAGAEARRSAEDLLASPEGQTRPGRDRALAAAEQLADEAKQAVGGAAAAIRAAEQAVEQLLARRALPVRALPVPAAAPDEADALAAEQERAAEAARARIEEADGLLRRLEEEQRRYHDVVESFGLLLDGLPPRQDDDPPEPPFAGDVPAARAARAEAVRELAATQERRHAAETGFTEAVAGLRAVGGRFPAVRTPARDRVLNDRPDVLAAAADRLSRDLDLRERMIADELESIGKDQAIITASLAHLVRTTLENLRLAERYSRLPATLGPWAGKQMLRIGFEPPVTDDDLAAHIDQVIERCIADGIRPQGLPLLKAAVHEAVGPQGFRVKVLKPAQDVAAVSEDITRLGKWSGGEKLTVCVAIYCTLAALRARNTGRGNASGGVLMLDNPIGRASHASLVRLQRDVARAHGVQLIYTTGVKDPDAVSRFPNVIRLDNRPGRTRNRRYIVATGPAVDPEVSTVIGTRVAHDEPAGAVVEEADDPA